MLGSNNGLLIYSPFLVIAIWGLWVAPRRARTNETLVAGLFFAGLWLTAALHQSQFDAVAEETSGLGPRQVFPAVPLLAAFAAFGLSQIPRRVFLALAGVSIGYGYLGAQAGMTPGTAPFVYCLKTFVSGAGWAYSSRRRFRSGSDSTRCTRWSAAPMSAWPVWSACSPTADGLRLMRNQGLLLALNAVLVGAVVMVVVRLWRAAAEPRSAPV